MKVFRFLVGKNWYCVGEDGNVYNWKTRHQMTWQYTDSSSRPRRVQLSRGDGTYEWFTRETAEKWAKELKEESSNE